MKRLTDKIAAAGAPSDSGAPLILGRPTVAANTGALITSTLLLGFEESGLGEAEWVRLPKPGTRCRLSSLSRTTLNEAISRGDVRAITVRQPGTTRGIKLINKASLLNWLRRLDQEQNSPALENVPSTESARQQEGVK
jgi:hypothetical protein